MNSMQDEQRNDSKTPGGRKTNIQYIALLFILATWWVCFFSPYIALNIMTAEWDRQPSLLSLINRDDCFAVEDIEGTYYERSLIICFVGGGVGLILLLLRYNLLGGIILAFTDLGHLYCCGKTYLNFLDFFSYNHTYWIELTAVFGSGAILAAVFLAVASIIAITYGAMTHTIQKPKKEMVKRNRTSIISLVSGIKANSVHALQCLKVDEGYFSIVLLSIPILEFVVLPSIKNVHVMTMAAIIAIALIGCMFGCLAYFVALGSKKLSYLWIILSMFTSMLQGVPVFVVTTIALLLALLWMYIANRRIFMKVRINLRASLMAASGSAMIAILCMMCAAAISRYNILPAIFFSLLIVAISSVFAYLIVSIYSRSHRR